jgi:hypothetical protein
MEKAILINRTNQLKLIDDYDVVYFGCEFCERLLPSKKDFMTVKDYVERKGKIFSLLSPYVTNNGIRILRSTLKAIGECEVIFNDWGVFWMIKNDLPDKGFIPVLGRLLVKQKRGPRIIQYKHRIPYGAYQHFMRSVVSNKDMADYLAKQGILRVELDNLLQGIDADIKNINCSLYYPYLYVTTTRMCLIANKDRKNISVVSCTKQCADKQFILKSDAMPDILLRGNTQFIKNEVLPDYMGAINRLVFEPEIPY